MTIVSAEVHVRDELGRFIRDIEGAATKAVEKGLDVGIAAAQTRAPVRTGRLYDSFLPVILSRTSGVFINTAPYADYQDRGAGRHAIPARVHFFWEKAGRYWMWPETYERITGHPGADPIDHPGNPATHFMDAGYRAIVAALPRIIASTYPS